jgi:hypothetical protein
LLPSKSVTVSGRAAFLVVLVELQLKVLTKHTKIAISHQNCNSYKTRLNRKIIQKNGIDSEEASKEMIESALIKIEKLKESIRDE